MKKSILFIIFLLIVVGKLFSAGLPHAVYFQVYLSKGDTIVYPDSISFTAWITDREDEILTEKSFGCGFYKEHSLAAVQVGNFHTPWQPGDLLNIEVNSNLGHAFRTIEIDNSSAQYFVKDYKGDNGLPLKPNEKKLFKIYPNPFSKKLTIELMEKNSAQIILKRNDKIIYKNSINKKINIIDTISLPDGIYMIEIKINGKIFKKKLVKI